MADRSFHASDCFFKGNMYFDREDYDKAIVLFTLSLSGKCDENTFHNLAISYYMKGHYLKAARNYAISLAIKPDFCRSFNGWGFCLLNLGRYDEAILKFKKAVEVDKKYTQGFLNWGLVLYWKKEEAEAKEIVEKALKNSSLSKGVIVERYESELSLTEKRLAKAANEEDKARLKEQILGYRWMLELIPQKMEDEWDLF